MHDRIIYMRVRVQAQDPVDIWPEQAEDHRRDTTSGEQHKQVLKNIIATIQFLGPPSSWKRVEKFALARSEPIRPEGLYRRKYLLPVHTIPTGRGKQTHQSALPFPLLFTVEAMAVSRVNRKGSFSEEERKEDREDFREMKLWRK